MSVAADDASGSGVMKSFSKNGIRRGFFPEGAFNVRVASDPTAMAKNHQHLDDSDDATPVLEVAPSLDHHHSPPSASKKPSSSSSSSSSCTTTRALFTFPSKWDDAEKWLRSSTKSGKKQHQGHAFKKLHQHSIAHAGDDQESDPQADRVEEEDFDDSEDREKKMMIDSSTSSSAAVVVSRFSFPMIKISGNVSNDKPSETAICDGRQDQQVGMLRIQKPSADLSDSHFDFKQAPNQQHQQPQQQPKSPTSLYESVACIAPGARSISMRDMGTEMTPIASQEPSRTATPIVTPTEISPARLRPIPPPPQSIPANYRSTGTDASPPPPPPPPSLPPAAAAAGLGEHPIPQEDHDTLVANPATHTRNATRHEILVLGTQLGKSSIAAWATREEEESDASKCLKVVIQQQQQHQHQQQNPSVDSARPAPVDLEEVRRTMVESRATAWEEAEHAKYMARYEREEAKIVAWENHQKAKAEAELRRMEVKVERMRSHAHERMMNKLAAARRRAEELRAAAEAKKGEKAAKTLERASEIRRSGSTSSSSSSSSHLFRCCLAGV